MYLNNNYYTKLCSKGIKFVSNNFLFRLCIIQRQTNTSKMQDKLGKLLEWLESTSKTKSMADYLNKNYVAKAEMWATCHRIGLGINTNMFVEAFHKVFKHHYLKGKQNRRVDTCLINLLKYDRDRSYKRLINLTKNKTPYRYVYNLIHITNIID